MVTMFIRAYELVHGKVGTDVTELAYSDQATIPAWAIESIAKATFLNKVKSYSGSTFEPLKQANYSDAAKVISGLWVSSN